MYTFFQRSKKVGERQQMKKNMDPNEDNFLSIFFGITSTPFPEKNKIHIYSFCTAKNIHTQCPPIHALLQR